MSQSRDFVPFACTQARVESIRITKRGELAGCHPMVVLSHDVQSGMWRIFVARFLNLGCLVVLDSASNVPNDTSSSSHWRTSCPRVSTMVTLSSNSLLCFSTVFTPRSLARSPRATTSRPWHDVVRSLGLPSTAPASAVVVGQDNGNFWSVIERDVIRCSVSTSWTKVALSS